MRATVYELRAAAAEKAEKEEKKAEKEKKEKKEEKKGNSYTVAPYVAFG